MCKLDLMITVFFRQKKVAYLLFFTVFQFLIFPAIALGERSPDCPGIGSSHPINYPKHLRGSTSSTDLTLGYNAPDDPLFGKPTTDFFPSKFKDVIDKAFIASSFWKINPIKVCWENLNESKEEDRLIVRNAIKESWEKNSCLNFSGWEQCQAEGENIRIKVKNSGGAYACFIGEKLKNKKNGIVFDFTFKDWGEKCSKLNEERTLCIQSIAVHEFGHALAYAHEHMRIETPGECIEKLKIRGAYNGNDVKGDYDLLTEWDKCSAMNYCNNEFNNNGKLSVLDINALHHFYCEQGGAIGENREKNFPVATLNPKSC